MADSTPTDSVSVDIDSISPSPKAFFVLSTYILHIHRFLLFFSIISILIVFYFFLFVNLYS